MKSLEKGGQFSDRKQISGYLGVTEGAGRWERVGGNTKGLEEVWGEHHYLDYGYGFMGVYMSKQKCIF